MLGNEHTALVSDPGFDGKAQTDWGRDLLRLQSGLYVLALPLPYQQIAAEFEVIQQQLAIDLQRLTAKTIDQDYYCGFCQKLPVLLQATSPYPLLLGKMNAHIQAMIDVLADPSGGQEACLSLLLNTLLKLPEDQAAFWITRLKKQFAGQAHLAHWQETLCMDSAIEVKAEINAQDKKGLTLLARAARDGHADRVRYLIAQKASIEAESNTQYRPVHWAAQTGKLKALKILIEAKADIEAQDQWGFTPLIRTARNGHADCIRYLLAQGPILRQRTILSIDQCIGLPKQENLRL